MPYAFDPSAHRQSLVAIIHEIAAYYASVPSGSERDLPVEPLSLKTLHGIVRRYPRQGGGMYSRAQLITLSNALRSIYYV